MITSVDNAILKTATNQDAQYVVYCLNLPGRLQWLESLSQVGGGHRWRISRSMLGNLYLPCPPHEEQVMISESLETNVEASISVALRMTEQIKKLKEYRQSLITAAVTGQLDIPTS